MEPLYTRDDLRSAVAAGLLTEAQAAGVIAHGDARAGRRASMSGEDEPFELFKGFADIFVSVGLVLVLSGVLGLATIAQLSLLIPALTAAACWGLANYFTLRRRMTLPSIVLVSGFAAGAGGAFLLGWGLLTESFDGPLTGLVVGGLTLAALALYYRRFKVPFTLFLVGLVGLCMMLVLTSAIVPEQVAQGDFSSWLDLREGSGLAVGTLVFGLIAFLGGMWFDMHDPHRLGRWSASGFWLHMLAAPALVNTVVLTLYNVGGTAGYLLTIAALALIAAMALVIDRRSFLTAGIGYLALVIGWALEAGTGGSPILLLLILGGAITALGTWWVPMRNRLMRALPDFPGKARLPPYGAVG